MKFIFNPELFFVDLANLIAENPNLQQSFDEYYEADKYRFYECATRSKQYNPLNMSCKPLEIEVATRRAFGILLCAEEDETTRNFVCGRLLDTDKRFAELVKNPNRADLDALIIDEIRQMRNKPDSDETKIAPIYFLVYLLYVTYGTDSGNQTVNDFLSHTQKVISDLNKRKTCHSDRLHQSLKTNGVTFPKKSQALIKQLKNGLDLSGFLDFIEHNAKTGAPQHIKTEIVRHIKDYYNLGREESQDTKTAIAIVQLATTISEIISIDLDGLREPVSVTNDEQNMIIKMLADMYPRATASELSQQISVTNYVIAHIFMLLMKEVRNTKEFYFRNNSETQYLEFQRLESDVGEKDVEIEYLKAELARSNGQNERQKVEIQRLTDKLSKENKDAVKPYMSEISKLNARVRELEKGLESEQEKIPELNALREFAFAAQVEYIPPETNVTLAEATRDKKIIVIGGHVNWRNRMKERYPAIAFLDGHNKMLNTSVFENADFVLFFTSNMAHTVYEKIIYQLRDKKIQFGYLGRSTNHELLEAEIVSILQEKI
jgi:uncharacterized coiled-coil protein SlyX